MNQISVDDICTREEESFEVAAFEGRDAPHAYHINYKNYGYGRFIIDDKSLDVFAK